MHALYIIHNICCGGGKARDGNTLSIKRIIHAIKNFHTLFLNMMYIHISIFR